MVLGDLIHRNAQKFPDKVAVIFEDKRISFRNLNDRINRLANALISRGVKTGDRVAILNYNSPQYLESFFATWKAGAISVPLDSLLKGRELEFLINDCTPKILLLGENYCSLIDSIRTKLKSVERYICIGAEQDAMESYESLIASASAEEPQVNLAETDCASIVYTSGTTGKPKGAMVSHKSHVADARNLVIELSLRPYDVALTIFPFYHTGGISIMLRHMYVGNTQVLMRAFDPKKVLETLAQEKCSIVVLVPTMLTAILQVPEIQNYDLQNLRMIGYGGASMPVEVLRQGIKIFKCEFVNIYGQTEAGPVMTVLRPEDHHVAGPPEKVKKLASVGRSLINFEVRVIDDAGTDVKPGQVGELIGRGENLMIKYWNRSEETVETLKEGWLYTGDLATVDEDGFIYIVDRKKDMIVSGGQNIYPREIEELLYTHPAILEAAVIGVPHDYWGETVKAVVALKKGMKATEKEIIQFCKENLASYKKPTSVDFMEALPKSSQGKILKKGLKELYAPKK